MTVLSKQTKGQTKKRAPEKVPEAALPAEPKIVEASAKLTAKNQTTIPTSVRSALGLTPMDRIKFQILPDGRVELTRAAIQEDEEEFDPMVLAFLDFIEADIIANPQILSVLQRDKELTELLKDVVLDENLS